nr:unnamed protein product [Callosobruchus chinensis]
MVSTNSSPPIAMPVQVPPGHMVQQIVDESGTLRHVILSPQHPPNMVPLPSHNPQHYSSGPQGGTNQSQYYTTTGGGAFSPGPPNSGQPPHFHGGMPPPGGGTAAGGGGVPSPTHQGHSPPPPSQTVVIAAHPQTQQVPPPAYFRDERTHRQHIKLRRKLNEKQKNNNGTEKADAILRKDFVNGLKRSGEGKEKGMNSVGTSEDGEESSVPDEEDPYPAVIDVLSSVQAPKVSELTSRSALLQWAPPIRLSETASSDSHDLDIQESDLRYEVLLSDKSKEMKFKSIYSGTSLSCRIQDLKPGQEYAVCLQVHLDKLQGFATDPVRFSTPPCEPDQPQPPKILHRTKNSLQLRWNAVNDNGAPVLHYVLEYCDASKVGGAAEWVEFYRGRGKTHTLQKLQPATAYAFRMAVVNEVGMSLYSDCVTYATFDNPPTQPAPPSLLEAGVHRLSLAWQKQAKRDDEFMLQMNDVEAKYGFLNVYNGKESYHVCSGLNRSSDYIFRLRVKNEDGTSPWSEDVTYRTLPDRPARPSKPVVKGRIHAHSFKLKWEPPADAGGAKITRYLLEVNSGSGYEPVYSGPETEAICDRLTPGTTYQLRVCCQSIGGQSDYSDPCTVTTDAISPGRCPPPRPVGRPRSTAAHLRWAEPDYNGGAPVLDYEVEMVSPDSTRGIVYKNKECECLVTDLRPGCDYLFAVRAVNRIGPGPWSETSRVTSGAAPPDAPDVPKVAAKSPWHVAVEWSEPRCNGAPVTEYKLEMSSSSAEVEGEETEETIVAAMEGKFANVYQGPLTCYDLKTLIQPHHWYAFRVQAANSAGCSAYSEAATTRTPAAPPSAPAAPKGEVTPTSVRLRWHRPNDNGAPVTHYNVELGDRTIATEGPINELTVDGLQPNTTYKVKVQAVNSVAAGPFSASAKICTLRLPPSPPKLECSAAGHNYLKLKWGEGRNVDYVQYTVEMENHRTREYQCVYKGTALTCKVNKLHETTTYSFRINATNDAGVGNFSDVYQFSTSLAPPAAVKMPKATEVERTGCTLEWLPAKNPFADPVVYLVLLARGKEQTFKTVHRTHESKHQLEHLDAGTEYHARIVPVRLSGEAELQGPPSPSVTFTTLASTELSSSTNATSSALAAQAGAALHHKRGGTVGAGLGLYHSISKCTAALTDEYRTFAYVVLITLLGILISLGIEAML